MKIHDYLFYIKQDKWEKFLQNYDQFGYKHEGGFAYPDYVYKEFDDGKTVKVKISDPCVNMWDNEDKNQQREVWVWEGCYGKGKKEIVQPYITDLINAGYIE
jgi:hypothetical protein